MRFKTSLIFCLVLLIGASAAWAEEKGGGDLRSAVQNPISSLISREFIPAWVSVDGFIEGTADISMGRPGKLNCSLCR